MIILHCCDGYDMWQMDTKFYSYSVFITVAVCLFQVASNSSDDIPDENSNWLS